MTDLEAKELGELYSQNQALYTKEALNRIFRNPVEKAETTGVFINDGSLTSINGDMNISEINTIEGIESYLHKTGVINRDAKQEGTKFDQGKLRHDLIEPEFLDAIAYVLTYGAEKYGDKNWQGLKKQRVEASLLRHINNYRKGEKTDRDEPHGFNLAAVAVNAMFLLWLDIHGKE